MIFLTEAYKAWQEALASEFFGPEHAYTPVVFHVDDEKAADIQEAHGLTTSLAEAVRHEVRIDIRKHAFRRILQAASEHRDPEQPPPSLPLLAATVVAASRMASEPGIRKTNFRARLGDFLYGPDSTDDICKTLIQSAHEFGELWKQLDQWLQRTNGRYGSSTITTDTWYKQIGYPISQALIRKTDRMALTQFFKDADLEPSDADEGDYIISTLSLWARRRTQILSTRFHQALFDKEEQQLALLLTQRLLRAWDGTVLDPSSGRRLTKLRLHLQVRPLRLGWAAEAAPGVESGTLYFDGSPYTFTQEVGRFYSGLGDLPFTPASLIKGATFRAETKGNSAPAFVYQPADVVVFAEDPEIGWVSQDAISPFEEHILLVFDKQKSQVERVLDEAAEDGWRKVSTPPTVGWTLYRRVVFQDGFSLSRALRNGALVVQDALRPAPVKRPRLVGGLRVARHLDRRTYLAGGGPQLLLRAGLHGPRPTTVTLDGLAQNFQANGFPIPIPQDLLTPGDHTLSADGIDLDFTIVEHVPAAPGTSGVGSLGFLPHGGRTASRPSPVSTSEPAICGANVPRSIFDPPGVALAQRVARKAVLISHDGRVRFSNPPKVPRWLEEAGILTPYYFDVEIPRGWSGWLLQQLHSRWAPPQAIDPVSPDLQNVQDSSELQLWAELVIASASYGEGDAWQSYVSAARRILS